MARQPSSSEYPDEIVTDREIQPLTTGGGRIPTSFILIAGAAGLATLVLLQFMGGNNRNAEPESKPVVSIPAATPADLPTPRSAIPEPQVFEEEEEEAEKERFDNLNVLEIERLRQIALLEEQKRQLEAQRAAEEERKRKQRLQSGLVLIDNGGSAPASSNADPYSELITPNSSGFDEEMDENDRNELNMNSQNRYLRDASNEKVVKARAVILANQDYLLTQGTFITGITETAINSDLPGMIRAIVDKPVYGRTGKLILVPKGSRLVGRYQSGVTTGQKRVYIVWTRLERPDGAVIALGSPGADSLGRSGMAGDVDTHFFERFGASTLLSAIGPALSALLDDGNQSANTQEIIQGGRDGFERQSAIALRQSINIPPTITVPQGSEVTIFVNRDLSFDAIEG